MSLVAYEDSEGEEEQKEVCQKSSTATKNEKNKPITFTVPVNTSVLKETKRTSDDTDEEERPRKKLQTGNGVLSFLPAPKHSEEKLIKPKVQPILKSAPAPQPKPKLPPIQDDEDKNELLKQESQPSLPRRVPLSFANSRLKQEEQEPEISAPSQPPLENEPEVGPSYPDQGYEQNYPYSNEDYNYANYYPQPAQLYYPPQAQAYMPMAPNIPKSMARGFKDMRNASMIEIRQDDMKDEIRRMQQANQDTTQEYNALSEIGKKQMKIELLPDQNQKKQHQVTYLLWEAKQKAAEIEAKRAEGRKNRKEARQKYGW